MYKRFLALAILLAVPGVVSAQFSSLVNIPGLPEGDTSVGLAAYVQALFYMAVGVAAMFAVVKLVIAGARYMLSDVANTKEAAKSDIRGAITGLLLVIATVLILLTINAQILNSNIALEAPSTSWPQGELTYGGGGDESNPVEEACQNSGGQDRGDCDVVSCQTLESSEGGSSFFSAISPINFATRITAYGLDSALCEAYCEWAGGERITSGLTDSGECVYPNDPETAAANMAENETLSIIEDAENELDVPEGALIRRCSEQGGPTRCQATQEQCTSGSMSPQGESGSPVGGGAQNAGGDIGAVIVCSY